ncbi:hypothetical protein RQP46_002332 [Phenoliferia psychrophenolica]
MVVMAEHGGLDYSSRDGHFPFKPAAASTATHYVPDVTQINASYFDFVDWVIDEAAKLGILIMLVPTWGRYFNYGYYPTTPLLFDEENVKVLGEYLGERYPWTPFICGGDSNRFWSQHTITAFMAGDKDAIRNLPIHDSGPVTEALAAALLKGALPTTSSTEYTPFITYHPAACWLTVPATSASFFPDADWLSMDVIQSGHSDGRGNQGDGGLVPMWKATSSYLPVSAMYAHLRKDGTPRPVQDMEGHYESTRKGFEATADLWGAADIRNGAYQAVFAGACGVTYGVNSIWQMHNPKSKTHPPIAPPTTAEVPWYDELDLPGSFHIAHVRRLILSLPSFPSRVPDQSFILSNTHEGEGDSLVSGLRAGSREWALVYTPKGEPVDVDASVFGGRALGKAEWFDPRTEERTGIEVVDGSWKFTPPSAGSIEDDWVLVLHARV